MAKRKPRLKPGKKGGAAAAPPPAEYVAHRADAAARSREKSKTGREAGPLPPVADPARRESCRLDLRRFFETYFPERFTLAWSDDHLTAIAKMQAAILDGGQMAYAMPRSSGKTALAEAGAVFALLHGHRRFVALIGASEDAAKEMLLSIKTEFEANDLLAADFPEVCHLIRALEGINNRANGQTLNGERTRIAWTDTRAVLPTVPGSPSSGSRLRVAGITGRIRGMKATVTSGENIRPDLCVVDDPQTDDSATSPAQNTKREHILNGAVLGLAGPRTKIACFAAVTVIAPGDLADRILDRQRHPVWQGERSRMVLSWPANRDLWDRYADLRKQSQRLGGKGEDATAFYLANREAMDAGAAVSWPVRFYPDEHSGVQHAMNLRCDRGERAFMAEFQNDPQPEEVAGRIEDLDPDAVAKKVNNTPRGVVPPDCAHLTAFVDVGESVHFYMVVAWDEKFSGAVVDYGTCPRQNRAYFASEDARPSLADVFPRHDVTARIYAGLRAVVDSVVARPYPRANGGEARVGVCLVDTGHRGDTVYAFCREHPLAAVLMPGRGHGITAGKTPMDRWAARPGERAGWHWKRAPVTGTNRGQHVIYDTNHWKSFAADRLLTPPGGVGCLSLCGEPGRGEHQLLADHLTSETRVRTRAEQTGRTVDEWAKVPGRNNHWWDCLVGAAVGASYLGAKWSAAGALGEEVRAPAPGKRRSFAEAKAAANAKRKG